MGSASEGLGATGFGRSFEYGRWCVIIVVVNRGILGRDSIQRIEDMVVVVTQLNALQKKSRVSFTLRSPATLGLEIWQLVCIVIPIFDHYRHRLCS